MANTGDINEDRNGNAFKCRVTLMVPQAKVNGISESIYSLTDWIDPHLQIVDVDEKNADDELYVKDVTVAPLPGRLVSPALSVILFKRENRVSSALKRPPWQAHHTIESKNKTEPNQYFFKLGDELPLFSESPGLNTNGEHIRMHLYVHKFDEMAEFYSAITQTERESNKPEFCLFEVYNQRSRVIKLSLKRCPYIYPVPVKSAYISFNVNNIADITKKAKFEVVHVEDNVYTTHDPDGNLVVLYENEQSKQDEFSEIAHKYELRLTPRSRASDQSLFSFDDVNSIQSTTDSNDSGRASDVDAVF